MKSLIRCNRAGGLGLAAAMAATHLAVAQFPGMDFRLARRGRRSRMAARGTRWGLRGWAYRRFRWRTRLIGWSWVELAAGESKTVSVPVERDRLTVYDEASDSWKLVPGGYTVMAGGSSQELPLHQQVTMQ